MLDFRPRTALEVIDAAVGVARTRYAALVTLAALAFLPYATAEALVFARTEQWVAADVLAWLASAAVADAALSCAVADAMHGRAVDPSRAAGRTLRRAAPVIGAMLAKWVLVCLGLLLLVVPGVLLYARLVAVPAVVVLERRGVAAALGRSWRLTGQDRASVLGLAILVLALTVAVNVAVHGAAPAALPVLGRLMGTVVTVLLAPVLAAITTVLYYNLRVRREGYDVEVLGAALSP